MSSRIFDNQFENKSVDMETLAAMLHKLAAKPIFDTEWKRFPTVSFGEIGVKRGQFTNAATQVVQERWAKSACHRGVDRPDLRYAVELSSRFIAETLHFGQQWQFCDAKLHYGLCAPWGSYRMTSEAAIASIEAPAIDRNLVLAAEAVSVFFPVIEKKYTMGVTERNAMAHFFGQEVNTVRFSWRLAQLWWTVALAEELGDNLIFSADEDPVHATYVKSIVEWVALFNNARGQSNIVFMAHSADVDVDMAAYILGLAAGALPAVGLANHELPGVLRVLPPIKEAHIMCVGGTHNAFGFRQAVVSKEQVWQVACMWASMSASIDEFLQCVLDIPMYFYKPEGTCGGYCGLGVTSIALPKDNMESLIVLPFSMRAANFVRRDAYPLMPHVEHYLTASCHTTALVHVSVAQALSLLNLLSPLHLQEPSIGLLLDVGVSSGGNVPLMEYAQGVLDWAGSTVRFGRVLGMTSIGRSAVSFWKRWAGGSGSLCQWSDVAPAVERIPSGTSIAALKKPLMFKREGVMVNRYMGFGTIAGAAGNAEAVQSMDNYEGMSVAAMLYDERLNGVEYTRLNLPRDYHGYLSDYLAVDDYNFLAFHAKPVYKINDFRLYTNSVVKVGIIGDAEWYITVYSERDKYTDGLGLLTDSSSGPRPGIEALIDQYVTRDKFDDGKSDALAAFVSGPNEPTTPAPTSMGLATEPDVTVDIEGIDMDKPSVVSEQSQLPPKRKPLVELESLHLPEKGKLANAVEILKNTWDLLPPQRQAQLALLGERVNEQRDDDQLAIVASMALVADAEADHDYPNRQLWMSELCQNAAGSFDTFNWYRWARSYPINQRVDAMNYIHRGIGTLLLKNQILSKNDDLIRTMNRMGNARDALRVNPLMTVTEWRESDIGGQSVLGDLQARAGAFGRLVTKYMGRGTMGYKAAAVRAAKELGGNVTTKQDVEKYMSALEQLHGYEAACEKELASGNTVTELASSVTKAKVKGYNFDVRTIKHEYTKPDYGDIDDEVAAVAIMLLDYPETDLAEAASLCMLFDSNPSASFVRRFVDVAHLRIAKGQQLDATFVDELARMARRVGLAESSLRYDELVHGTGNWDDDEKRAAYAQPAAEQAPVDETIMPIELKEPEPSGEIIEHLVDAKGEHLPIGVAEQAVEDFQQELGSQSGIVGAVPVPESEDVGSEVGVLNVDVVSNLPE